MPTSLMAPPTGSSSLPISSRKESRNTELYISAESPPILQLNGVNLARADHLLTPWLTAPPLDLNSIEPARNGGELCGIEWISVEPWEPYDVEGKVRHRLVHNARPVLIKQPVERPGDVVQQITINDGAFTLHMPFPGLAIPRAGCYLPAGALQIIVDDKEGQIISSATTLPVPQQVETMPCSGWCKKRHLYTNFGMDEIAVVFYNRYGWPIACRENILCAGGGKRTAVSWWRFDYNRPDPEMGL